MVGILKIGNKIRSGYSREFRLTCNIFLLELTPTEHNERKKNDDRMHEANVRQLRNFYLINE